MAKPSKSNLRFIKDPAMVPYYIQLDDYCYIAQKSTYSESGKEYQMTLGHYNTQLPLYGKLLLKMLKGTKYENLKLLGCIVVLLKDNAEYVEHRVPKEVIDTILGMDVKKYLTNK
jgi:hypothetical protein